MAPKVGPKAYPDATRARRRVVRRREERGRDMKTIRQSKVVRTRNGHCRVGDIVIFDVLGAAWQKPSKFHMTTSTAKRF